MVGITGGTTLAQMTFKCEPPISRGLGNARVVNVQRSGDQFRILEAFQTFYWLPIAFIESLDLPGYAFDAVDSPQKAS